MRRSFVVILSSWLLLFAAASRSAADGGDHVVLLHGLGRSHWSMMPLEARLEDAGFEVTNLGYPSTELDPDGLVAYVESAVAACCSGASRLHFVTHSLGGILVRGFLAKHRPPNLGRVVMLAPPNRGSELVDELVEWPLFSWILGPTAAQLGTNTDSFPNRLPPVDFDLGVIAGTESLNPIGSAILPEGNDGTVSVASTRVEGMRDFVAVPASHTFIMWSEYAADKVVEYLRNGRFDSENGQEK